MTFEYVPRDGRFDPALCIRVGQVFRWRCADGVVRGEDGDTRYSIEPPHPNPLPRRGEGAGRFGVETSATKAEFERLFSLHLDANEIDRKLIVAAPEIEPYLGHSPGLRMMQPADAVEVFYSFLCTANNHLRRIVPMVNMLAKYGDGRFPSSEVVACIPEAELRSKAFGYRGATIPRAALEILRRGGDQWLYSLRDLPYEDAHNELLSIFGVGRKLADCIGLFGLHHTEAVPIDTHMWQAATRVFFPDWQGQPLTEERYLAVRDFFQDRFGKLAGWAHQQLYVGNLLRNLPPQNPDF